MGAIEVGLVTPATLPTGRDTIFQANVRVSPSTSVDPAPLRATGWPTSTVWSAPAFATGAEFTVLIVTVAGAPSTTPSLTISRMTYEPGRSIGNIGLTLS